MLNRHKTIFFAMLLCLSWPVISAAQVVRFSLPEKSWLNEHQMLRIGVVELTPPVLFFAGKSTPQGLVADYLRALALHLGLQLQITRYPDRQALMLALNHGDIDAIGAEVMGMQGQEKLIYTRPFLTLPTALFSEQSPSQGGLGGLSGKTIAVVRGSIWETDLPRMVPGVQTLVESDIEQALKAIANGRAYAYLGDAASANYLLERQEIGQVREQLRPDITLDVTLATPYGEPQLQSLLQKGFDRIDKEELQEIWRRWPNVEKPVEFGLGLPATWIWIVVVLAWSLFLGWAVRYETLRRHKDFNLKLRRAVRRLQRREKRLKQKLLLLKRKALEYRGNSRMQKQRLSLMNDVMPSAAWVWDPSAGQCQWDEAMYALYGREAGSFEPTPGAVLQFVHEDDQERVADLCGHLEEEGEVRISYRILLPDGEIRWLLDYSHFSRSDETDEAQRVGICWDITDYMTLSLLEPELQRVES